jgi:hypothetical protein
MEGGQFSVRLRPLAQKKCAASDLRQPVASESIRIRNRTGNGRANKESPRPHLDYERKEELFSRQIHMIR